ncbi:MAG: hypothetical protein K6G61_08090 [Solobacterium sp.]|nr:hypothetical protein [Solobacterium sp.]
MNDRIKKITEELAVLVAGQKNADAMTAAMWQDKAGRIASEKIQQQTDILIRLLAEFESLQEDTPEETS